MATQLNKKGTIALCQVKSDMKCAMGALSRSKQNQRPKHAVHLQSDRSQAFIAYKIVNEVGGPAKRQQGAAYMKSAKKGSQKTVREVGKLETSLSNNLTATGLTSG